MTKFTVALVTSVALALGVSACGSTAGAAKSADTQTNKVNFVLNYTPGPQHEEFVVAEHRGFYKDAGLSVNVTTPAATTDPIKLVASGQSDFGIAYAGDVISAAAQSVPVVALATIHRRIALGLLSKPSSGIKTPKDLIGKTIGLTPIPNNRAMFDDFLKRNNVAPSQVKIVPVNFNGPQLVAAGKIDAADAVSWYENGVYKQLTGQAPNYMEFTDYGVPNGYFFTVITSKSYLAGHKDVAKKFVAATLDAEKWTLENPDAANKILVDNVKDVSLSFAQSSRAILKTVIVDTDSKTHGIGWSNPDVWARQVKFYQDSGLVKGPIDPSALFTNDYLPAQPVLPNVTG